MSNKTAIEWLKNCVILDSADTAAMVADLEMEHGDVNLLIALCKEKIAQMFEDWLLEDEEDAAAENAIEADTVEIASAVASVATNTENGNCADTPDILDTSISPDA